MKNQFNSTNPFKFPNSKYIKNINQNLLKGVCKGSYSMTQKIRKTPVRSNMQRPSDPSSKQKITYVYFTVIKDEDKGEGGNSKVESALYS